MEKIKLEIGFENGEWTVEGTGATVEQKDEKIVITPEKEKEVLTWKDIMNAKAENGVVYLNPSGCIRYGVVREYETRALLVNTKRQAEKLRAIAQMFVIADHYNEMPGPEEWVVPYWHEDSMTVVFTVGKLITSSCTPRFKNHDLCMKAYEHNRSIFETALKP